VLIYTTAQATGKGVTASISPNAWRELLDTLPGQGLIVRFLLVCGVGWLALDPQKILDPATQFFSIALIVLLCATFGFDRTGGRLPALGYVNAMVHMLAISAWFGGLVLLVRVVLIGPGESDLMDAVRGFGRIASRAIVLVVLTGVFSTYRFDGFSLFTSQHGRLVLVKILLVGFMAYATFVTRTFVLTRLNRATTLTTRAAARLRRAVGVEAGVGVVVLGVTAWMMATTPIHFIEKAPAGGPVYAFSQDLKNERFHVRFSVSPATVGPNQVLIELFEPRRIQDFTVRMTPKADGYDGYLITVPLTRRGAALVGANGEFPMKAPGDWTIEINGTSTTGDLEPLSTTLTLVDPATLPTSTVPTNALPTSTVPTTSTALTAAPSTSAAPSTTVPAPG
jgi:putative copper export protein